MNSPDTFCKNALASGLAAWCHNAARFVMSCYDNDTGGYRSVPGGMPTLYGTCYSLLTLHYLGAGQRLSGRSWEFISHCQDRDTGYFVGPELLGWTPPAGAKHDREHLLMHLTCTVLPVLAEFGLQAPYPLHFAHPFVDQAALHAWLEARNLRDAWFEGNNLLFVGQLLAYLRDVERVPGAQEALNYWFAWLDERVDPATGLWGTDLGASTFEAMCGAYHQLLVYYHENRPVRYRRQLVDSVLSLQHKDGGFAPSGGGGACEDVDAVDILVNMYKQLDYRRAAIRVALRRCMRLILSIANADGGFPYRRGVTCTHMGIPATTTTPGGSGAFSTWFRVHTLALIAEILTDEDELRGQSFRFNRQLSMGWHLAWDRSVHPVGCSDRLRELAGLCRLVLQRTATSVGSKARRMKRRLMRVAQMWW